MIVPLVGAGFFVVLALVAKFVLKRLSETEKPSSFFEQNVETEYRMDFPDKEWELYEQLRDRVKDKYPDAGKNWKKEIKDMEIKLLIQSVRPAMIKSIENLSRLQTDKPGYFKLWRSKLITEEFWESLTEAEEEVKKDISKILAEVNSMSNLGDAFFDDCVRSWKQSKARVAEADEKQRLVEEKKQAARNEKLNEIKEQQAKERENREREKLAASLMAEEARESKTKKRQTAKGGKKK